MLGLLAVMLREPEAVIEVSGASLDWEGDWEWGVGLE